MKNKSTLILLFSILYSCSLWAQMSTPRAPRRLASSLLADNGSISKQSHALDSVISKHIKDDVKPEDEFPADDMYDGAWETSGVNGGRVEYAKVPDSVYFDLTGYIPPVEGDITSHFGPRKRRYHYGIDLKLSVGDPVSAAFDGKVRITKYDRGGYGSYIVVRHDNGLETLYGHLSGILVTVGQTVRAGQTIGLGGNTGRSTGPHLHFETRFLGNPINPEKFFDFELGEAKLSRYFMVKAVAFDYKKERNNYSESDNSGRSKHHKGKKGRNNQQFHKVKDGETLSHIAEKHGVSIKELCRLNGISKKKLRQPGQKIRYN